MYVITVIPIKRKIPLQELSYFFHTKLEIGTLVTIPFLKKDITGIVLSSVPVTEVKSELKKGTFSLKKIKGVLRKESTFWKHVVIAAQNVAPECLTPLSHLLKYIIPENAIDSHTEQKTIEGKKQTITLLHGNTEIRIDHFKRIIRERFAKKESVVVVCPTIIQTEHIYKEIKKGISHSCFLLHSSLKKTEIKNTFSEIEKKENPVCIITTPHYALQARSDIGLYILEQEASQYYQQTVTEQMPIHSFFKHYTKYAEIDILYADILPRFQTLWEQNPSYTISRNYTLNTVTFVEKKQNKDLLDTYLKILLRHCYTDKKSIFIYTNRKGLAPISRCKDCGTEVSCPKCNLPMILRYKQGHREKIREFICTSCDTLLPSRHTCVTCGSWNITPQSIGTEGIYEAVKSFVKDTMSIHIIDDTYTPDHVAIQKIIEEVKNKKSFILIGTEKAIPFLKGIDYSVIPVYDRILATPGTNILENLLRLLYTLQEKTREEIIIPSNDTGTFTTYIKQKNIQKIIDSEHEIRKDLGYPPYGHILSIAIATPAGSVEKITTILKEYFQQFSVVIPPPKKINHENMRILVRCIIQIPKEYLYESAQEIHRFLRSLHYPFIVTVDPERINL